jgi:hypothetical protein
MQDPSLGEDDGEIGDTADHGQHHDGNEDQRRVGLAFAERKQITRPTLPPTSSPTTTPTTASVAPMRSPANIGGIEFGNSTFQKITFAPADGDVKP